MKTKVLTKYAILFKHSRGWTYTCMCDSAAKAQVYIRDHRTAFNEFQWKIVPCKVSFNLTDEMASGFR